MLIKIISPSLISCGADAFLVNEMLLAVT